MEHFTGESSSRGADLHHRRHERRRSAIEGSSRSMIEPINNTLLYESNHISQFAAVDTANTHGDDDELYIRAGKMWAIDPLTEYWVNLAGFKLAGLASRVDVDPGLLHALAERWRGETHSFHLPYGEMTITLQDVQMILGLPADGLPVTDSYLSLNSSMSKTDLLSKCQRLLGFRPGRGDLKKTEGSTDVSIKWLRDRFLKKDPQAQDWAPINEVEAQQRARGYIMVLLSTVLISGTQGKYCPMEYLHFLEDLEQTRTYSWSSAVLSYTYKGLCKWVKYNLKDLAGCGVLLQVWCWEHIGVGKPLLLLKDAPQDSSIGVWWVGAKTRKDNPAPRNRHFYRDAIDSLAPEGFTWRPWTQAKQRAVARICMDSHLLGAKCLPLIYFHIVEWQLPHRVYRQFGLPQPIPAPWDDRREWTRLHKITSWIKFRAVPWHLEHNHAMIIWNNRWESSDWPNPIGAHEEEYTEWYESQTRTLARRGPPPQPLSVAENALVTAGHFQEHGNANQCAMKCIKWAIKHIRKVQRTVEQRQNRKLDRVIDNFKESFILNGQLETFQRCCEGPLSPDSDDTVIHDNVQSSHEMEQEESMNVQPENEDVPLEWSQFPPAEYQWTYPSQNETQFPSQDTHPPAATQEFQPHSGVNDNNYFFNFM